MNIRTLATACVLFATVSLPLPARADLYQWDGGLSHGSSADANWSTGTNWVGGVAPSQYSSPGNIDVEFLGATARTTSNANFTLPPNGSRGAGVHGLTFDAGNTAYTLSTIDGGSYYIGAGGLVQNSSAAQSFTSNVSVTADESWTFGAGSGGVTLGGGLSIAAGGSLTVSTSNIRFSGNSPLTVGALNGVANTTYPNVYTGPNSLHLTSGGTLATASVMVGGYEGNGPLAASTIEHDGGTLTTGAISLGQLGASYYHLSGSARISATSLTVGENSVGNRFVQDGGSVTINGGTLAVGKNGSGTYTLKAGSISAGGISVGGQNTGNTFIQGGGTVALTNGMYVGGGRYGQGAYTLDGGQLTVSGGLGIGALGTGTFLQTAGTVTVSGNIGLGSMSGGNASYTLTGNTGSLSAGGITIGSATGPAVFTVNGGSLNVAAGGSFVVGASSSGTFTQNGGVVTLAQGGFLSLGSGLIGASNFNLNGGTLTVGRVGVGSGVFSSSTTTLSFSGGTLRANAASTTFVSGLTSAYVRASGAKIDSNGYTITIPQALVHDPALAGNARDGGLTKLGTGNLILSGTNTYNGGTLIAGGSLEAAVNGALGTGNVMLGPGAFTLTLDASVGDAIANTASLSLDSTVGGKLQLRGAAGGIQETVGALDINGVSQSAGTYGATGSGAQYIDDAHFAGTGVLAVTGFRGAEFSVLAGAVPEPGTGVLAGAGILLAAAWRRRRAGRAANVKHAGTTRA